MLSNIDFTNSGVLLSSDNAYLSLSDDSPCLVYQAEESDINRILTSLVGDLADKGKKRSSKLTLQTALKHPLEEIRLDWEVDSERTWSLPGLINVVLPAMSRVTLALQLNERGQPASFLLALTIAEQAIIQIQTNFAWGRDNYRELQNNRDKKTSEPPPPFATLKLTALKATSLLLLEMRLDQNESPKLLRQYNGGSILPLDPKAPDSLCRPIISGAFVGLHRDNWEVELLFAKDEYTLPFLNSDDQAFPYSVKLKIQEGVHFDLANEKLTVNAKFNIKIGTIELELDVDLEFNWETMAFQIDHGKGIDLYYAEATKSFSSFLGLGWTLVGEKKAADRYHFFTLETKNNNYGIVLAQGAYLDLSYSGISEEPIVFRTSRFKLSPDGLSLETKVLEGAVSLFGLNTKFTFKDSGLSIERNKIQGFTLKGSGPLPPDLVGEAMAEISLEFARRNDGNLTLVAGKAELTVDKPLECRNTRFQFSVNELGLKFVEDGKFHLYFTITGKARFVLAPGDNLDGPLSLLPNIEIELVECPLTGDMSVIGQHVNFLVAFPKPVSFNFLGAFELELRAIGFFPQAAVFNGDAAMQLTGQLKFAQGIGDVASSEPDYHKLFIGLPAEGDIFPRIYFASLAVDIKMGDAFHLRGMVNFKNSETEEGFTGEGTVQIQGLPIIEASFGFLRVRHDEQSSWKRAWFIYAQIGELALMIPVIQIYIREIGLGFGYRYTLVSIKAADEANDVKDLIKQLAELSKSQGDLAKQDRWAVDLEKPGEDVRWTIVFRALIAQNAAGYPYSAAAEKTLPSMFLFDVVAAFRSDFTFFMVGRGWINTNYYDFRATPAIRTKPFVSGFLLLSPRQKRFLVHVRSNPDGHLGSHPELPEFVKVALGSVKFSATLLIEPNLLHYELGWPNMLRWDAKLGPLRVSIVGGFIFRLSTAEFAVGTNFRAEGELEIDAGFSAGAFGVNIYAYARVAYGARYIGVIDFVDASDSVFYGGIGLELQFKVQIRFWIEALLAKINFRFSAEIYISAALEVAISGRHGPGLMGRAQIRLSAMGHGIDFTVSLEAGKDALDHAKKRTARILAMGLEATDVEALPGLAEVVDGAEAAPAAMGLSESRDRSLSGSKSITVGHQPQKLDTFTVTRLGSPITDNSLPQPHYTTFVMREQTDGFCYFVLLPQSELDSGEPGFLPAPPPENLAADEVAADFKLQFVGRESFELQQFLPGSDADAADWHSISISPESAEITWKANWDANVLEVIDTKTNTSEAQPYPLRQYLANAFIQKGGQGNRRFLHPYSPIFDRSPLRDERVQNPTENAYEAAVIGAVEQFRGSPHFKQDPNLTYDSCLKEAFDNTTSIYGDDIQDKNSEARKSQIANQVRGLVLQDLIADLQDYLGESDETTRSRFAQQSIAFQMGLVFRVPTEQRPSWLDQVDQSDADNPRIFQRLGHDRNDVSLQEAVRYVRPFNIVGTDFYTNPPQFENIQILTDSYTVAINWDLTWPTRPAAGCTGCQADPDHHLMHYRVTRRALNSLEPEKVFTVKSGYVLHRGKDEQDQPIFNRLLPRFQIVDHFAEETLEERTNLPATGRSYAYTITPVDFSQSIGRSLTVVGTRYPDAPPLVPVDGELVVTYRLSQEQTAQPVEETIELPPLLSPHHIRANWTEPTEVSNQPEVPIATYRLIFRQESILPVGSYGLDGAVQGSRTKTLPSTNARPRPTDIKVRLNAQGSHRSRYADIPLSTLQEAGVFPSGDAPPWQPRAWRVYLQSISTGDVPSALAPVTLILRIENEAGLTNTQGMVVKEREERQPAELEWLPKPINLPPLPPEDGTLEVGKAHFPMPSVAAPQFLTEDSGQPVSIEYQPHPLGIRAVRLRWNQGPSRYPAFPLGLNAGYHLWELDIDAHTTETFRDPQKLHQALRHLQEVQMVPDEDLWLIPGDTLNPVQWQAWYPSTVARQRRGEASPMAGADNPLTPWNSWRESLLVWPKRETSYMATDLEVIKQDAQRENFWHKPYFMTNDHVHAYLVRLVQILETTGSPALYVDLQAQPPFTMGNLAEFWQATSPEVDRYGWKALQLMGLSLTFSLRQADTSRLLTGDEMISRIRLALHQLVTEAPSSFISNKVAWPSLVNHLHVELLVKGSEATRLSPTQLPSHNALLALVQISLRPIPNQRLIYNKLTIRGSSEAPLRLALKDTKPLTLIDLTYPAKGEIQIAANEQSYYAITLSPTGDTTLLIRQFAGTNFKPVVEYLLSGRDPKDIEKAKTTLASHKNTFVFAENPPRIRLIQPPRLLKDKLEDLRKALPTFSTLFDIDYEQQSFTPADPWSLYFSVPAQQTVGMQTEAATYTELDEDYFSEWENLQKYFKDTLYRYRTDEKIELRILPNLQEGETLVATSGPVRAFSDFIQWSQRFFDHGPLVINSSLDEDSVNTGPWLATAYAKQSTPTYVTPDKAGRLTYHHLLSDRWGHLYRYYIDPYSRYDRLWQAMHKSPTLFPESPLQGEILAPQPDVLSGGLDLVVPRSAPIDPPFILRSGRLDARAVPGNPAKPGKWWEVILAQHSEQALSEQNQTLARQLAFRQQIFSLLRQFAYADWICKFNEFLKPLEISLPQQAPPVQQSQDIPDSYPQTPTHLVPQADGWDEETLNALDIPFRLDQFQQRAVLLQWEALPFYYQHRLLVAAQADTVVSPIKEIIQQEFTYIAPTPEATLSGGSGKVTVPVNQEEVTITVLGHQIQLPLRQLWDSLPPEAQHRWQDEAPTVILLADHINPGAVPDLGIVYQIVDFSYGNVEVQAELYFDMDSNQFAIRQLSQQVLLAGEVGVVEPTFANPNERIVLQMFAARRQEMTLSRDYSLSGVATGHILTEGNRLIVQGVLTQEDKEAIVPQLESGDKEPFARFYQSWDRAQPISASLVPVPDSLNKTVRFITAPKATFFWNGSLSEKDIADLRALTGDQAYLEAIETLIKQVQAGDHTGVTVVRGPEQPPLTLPAGWQFDNSQWPMQLIWQTTMPPNLSTPARLQLVGDGQRYTALDWRGVMFAKQLAELADALREWGAVVELAGAIASLVTAFENIKLVESFNRRRTEAELEMLMGGPKLSLNKDRLIWSSPTAPTPADLTLLNDLPGDEGFQEAASQLATQLNLPITISVGPGVTLPADLNEVLIDQLKLQPGADPNMQDLVWLPPTPSQTQTDAMKALSPGISPPVINQLLNAVKEAKEVELESVNQPTNDQIPSPLRPNLQIEGEQISWTGLIDDGSQLIQLQQFANKTYEASFSEAILAIYQKLVDMQLTYALDFPIRLAPDQWDVSIQSRLTLAYYTLLYHGIMSHEDGQLLLTSYSHINDKLAIQRLYLESQTAGSTGHQLQIRALRGSASPSARISIKPHPLLEGGNNE
ncbi:MAG: hypothetical protein H6657_25525 [Ardenticatenaceae bacterium]|nr:hypothetical protein [Ardenticatenaceae bacterium]